MLWTSASPLGLTVVYPINPPLPPPRERFESPAHHLPPPPPSLPPRPCLLVHETSRLGIRSRGVSRFFRGSFCLPTFLRTSASYLWRASSALPSPCSARLCVHALPGVSIIPAQHSGLKRCVVCLFATCLLCVCWCVFVSFVCVSAQHTADI